MAGCGIIKEVRSMDFVDDWCGGEGEGSQVPSLRDTQRKWQANALFPSRRLVSK